MQIIKKNKLKQLFCKHQFETGVLKKIGDPGYFCLGGETHTTVCVKCGKIKSTEFVRNFDGS